MQKLLYAALACLLLVQCRPDQPNPITITVKITDTKGASVKETASGEMLILTSQQFSSLAPNGVSPNNAQLFFDEVPVSFQQMGPNAISMIVPVMNRVFYHTINIRFRINQTNINILPRILYRPRVTGEVLAGNDGSFQMPAEMTIDPVGNLYVIDQRMTNDVIMKVTPTGATSLFAGGANEFGRLVGIGYDPASSRIYLADATAQQVKYFSLSDPSTVSVLAGSGTPGNDDGIGTAASFRFGTERVDNFSSNEKGQSLHVDAMGNVYVGEQYGTASSGFESQIRKITPAGVVTTVPGSRITLPAGPDVLHPVAGLTLVPSTGALVYIGGASSYFQGIASINTAGTMTRIAGRVSHEYLVDGTGSGAEFAYPKAISFHDPYFHVADGSNGAYRRVSNTGEVITLAGVGHFDTPSFCFCGITGPRDSSYLMPSIFSTDPNRFKNAAKAIIMDQVGGIAVRNNNLVYLSDYGVNFRCIWRIRVA